MQTMLYFPSVCRLASATAAWVPCALVDHPTNTNIDTNTKDIAGQSTSHADNCDQNQYLTSKRGKDIVHLFQSVALLESWLYCLKTRSNFVSRHRMDRSKITFFTLLIIKAQAFPDFWSKQMYRHYNDCEPGKQIGSQAEVSAMLGKPEFRPINHIFVKGRG